MQQANAGIDWYHFLARCPLPMADADAEDLQRGASILVTGAGGSIGSSLVLRLGSLGVRKLILLEASESALHELQISLAAKISTNDGSHNPICYLGNLMDGELLDEIFDEHRPEWIFHAAAHKHVSLLEDHPLAGLSNNILGTHALCARAEKQGSRVILLSTDKAADPASMMGATKRAAELIVLAMGQRVVRLGNVVASRGSVVETFERQILRGEPITITDPEAERFWLTVEESTELLISATALADRRESVIMVPALERRHTVGDLAAFMIEQLASDQKIAIEVTGLKFGEKKAEVLWSKQEEPVEMSSRGLQIIRTQTASRNVLESGIQELQRAVSFRDPVRAIAALRSLVPEYLPSSRVLRSRRKISKMVQA